LSIVVAQSNNSPAEKPDSPWRGTKQVSKATIQHRSRRVDLPTEQKVRAGPLSQRTRRSRRLALRDRVSAERISLHCRAFDRLHHGEPSLRPYPGYSTNEHASALARPSDISTIASPARRSRGNITSHRAANSQRGIPDELSAARHSCKSDPAAEWVGK